MCHFDEETKTIVSGEQYTHADGPLKGFTVMLGQENIKNGIVHLPDIPPRVLGNGHIETYKYEVVGNKLFFKGPS